MRFSFIHAADLHLDTPFAGIAQRSAELADTLRDASLNAWRHIVDAAIQNQVAFVLLAGDIYDGAERGLRAQLEFKKGLDRLDAASIETFIVHGNHDPLDGYNAIHQLPKGVHIFGSEQVIAIPVQRDGQTLATVHGVSFQTRHEENNLALQFKSDSSPGLHIGLLHCNALPDSEHGQYAPCSIDDLRAANMDYWALGHIHKRQILQEANPAIVYPGNTQGRSPKPAERGPKGVTLVTIDNSQIQSLDFIPVDTVRFLAFDLDIANLPDIPAIRDALVNQAVQLTSEHPNRTLILRANLVGRGAAHNDLRKPAATDELIKTLNDETVFSSGSGGGDSGDSGVGGAGFNSGVWWDKISNAAAAPIDLDELLESPDFPGEIARFVQTLLGHPEACASFNQTHLAQLAKLQPFLDEDAFIDHAALLQDARDTALSLLTSEDSP